MTIDYHIDRLPLVFLCGHRKSGTSLFLNLFDGHRQLLTYPVDLNILYAYFPAFVEKTGLCDADLLNRLNRVVVDDLLQFDLVDRGFPIEEFRTAFFGQLAGKDLRDLGAVLSSQIAAFETVQGESEERQFALVKETSVELYAERLATTFPKARFIHLVRDPRDNYSALRAGLERYRKFGDDERKLVFSTQQRMSLGMKIAGANRTRLGAERYLVLRFEDLVTRAEETMRQVADWIGIDYDLGLLQPTLLSKPTRGNNYENQAMFTISSGNVGRWRERIPAEEAALVEFLLADEMEAFGYEREFAVAEHLAIIGDYYKWLNYTYLFFDRFVD